METDFAETRCWVINLATFKVLNSGLFLRQILKKSLIFVVYKTLSG